MRTETWDRNFELFDNNERSASTALESTRDGMKISVAVEPQGLTLESSNEAEVTRMSSEECAGSRIREVGAG